MLQKQLMAMLKCLCKGTSDMSKTDLVTLIAQLKSAKVPPSVQLAESGKNISMLNTLNRKHFFTNSYKN